MDLSEIHKLSIFNEDNIKNSNLCGCFYCGRIFKSTEVVDFLSEPLSDKKTAWCPYCNTDSVLGDFDIEITEDLLEKMNKTFFDFSFNNIKGF